MHSRRAWCKIRTCDLLASKADVCRLQSAQLGVLLCVSQEGLLIAQRLLGSSAVLDAVDEESDSHRLQSWLRSGFATTNRQSGTLPPGSTGRRVSSPLLEGS